MNRVFLTGRLTKDPVLEHTTKGTPFCRFNIATNRPVVREGEEKADFITCMSWNKQAEVLCKYQKKGNLIGVQGAFRVDKYESQGETRYKSYVLCQEIEFLSSKKTNVEKEYVDNFSVKTETQETIEYDEGDLPF